LTDLERLRDVNWREAYCEYQYGRLTPYEALVICHPRYYNEASDAPISNIRGPRAFSSEDLLTGSKCRAVNIWGYECPFSTEVCLQADHIFPYAYGGPTESANKLYLCSEHNRLKGCDLHYFDWEQSRIVWLTQLLARIEFHRRVISD
jgi:5-methylcytosine-specific restriction endonuclease McrA